MSALDRALCRPGEMPNARQHNAVLRHLVANRWLQRIDNINSPASLDHPWRVSASRFDVDRSTLNPESTWRVDLSPGFINDQPVSILYQRIGDPRGWQMPSGYTEPKNPDPRWIERDLLDDLDDPPCLVMQDPPLNASLSTASDWTRIPDDARFQLQNGAFCGASDWELELWRAHVIVSATPLAARFQPPSLPPPRLARYRLFTTPKLPLVTFGSAAGGWAELATLFLLRDPADPHGSAEVRILQREFYDFWAMIVTPGAELLGLIGDVEGDQNAGFIGLLQTQLEDAVGSGTEALFWSV